MSKTNPERTIRFSNDVKPITPPPTSSEIEIRVNPVKVDKQSLKRDSLSQVPPVVPVVDLTSRREVVPTPVKTAVEGLSERVGGNPLDFVQAVASGLASLPTSAVGGAVGGYKGGLMRTVEEIEMGLTHTRGRAELWRTVYEWADTLVNAQSAIELIDQLKKHNVFEEGATPEQAIVVAARFMNAVTNLREQEAQGEKRLAKVEQETLVIELKSMVLQAEAAGSLTVAPLTGAAVEIFGRLPVLLAKEIGPGMMEALAETLAVGAEIPGRTATAFIVGPFRGIADGIKEITEEITPGTAAGMGALAIPPVAVSILIATGALIPAATIGEKLLTVGVSGGIGMLIAVPIGAAVGLWDRRRNRAPKTETGPAKAPAEETEKPIEGKYRVVSTEGGEK